jgi:uncharacterized membrane protein YqjE
MQPGTPGLFDSVRQLLASVAELAHTRLDLFSTELQEALARLGFVLLLAIVVLFFAFLGVAFLSLALIIAVGEPHRLAAALWLGGGFLALGALGAWWMRSITVGKPRIFEASLSELRKDRDQLAPDR